MHYSVINELFPRDSVVKNLPAMQMQVQFLGREDPLEEGMATHSSILAWILENPMDRETWQAAVHSVTRSQT